MNKSIRSHEQVEKQEMCGNVAIFRPVESPEIDSILTKISDIFSSSLGFSYPVNTRGIIKPRTVILKSKEFERNYEDLQADSLSLSALKNLIKSNVPKTSQPINTATLQNTSVQETRYGNYVSLAFDKQTTERLLDEHDGVWGTLEDHVSKSELDFHEHTPDLWVVGAEKHVQKVAVERIASHISKLMPLRVTLGPATYSNNPGYRIKLSKL